MTIFERVILISIIIMILCTTLQVFHLTQDINQISELKGDIQTLSSIIKYQQSEIKMLKRKVSKF